MSLHNTPRSIEDSVRRHFEAAWLAGRPEPIEALLPPEDSLHYQATLLELVFIELEFWWKCHGREDLNGSGGQEPALVEGYLRRFPRLNDEAIILELLQQESYVRHQFGDRPGPEEYRRRFPSLVVTGTEVGITLPEGVPCGRRPQPIPGYEIVGELARGGMGVVYQARQLALNRPVAIKVLASGALAYPSERWRFLREAQATACLQHPNIVQVFEVGEHGGYPYITMEMVSGGNLARRIAGKPQPPAEAAQLTETLARAIHWTHQRGVIHRDLKPSNILLTEDGVPKIADFGVARHLSASSGATRPGDMLGTPSYMAPEQAAGRAHEAGPSADVYALGAILYELLTGLPPFRTDSPRQTTALVLSQEPVPPRRLHPRVPRDLEAICLKCLQKEPSRRYPSAAELADDLRRYLNGEPITARPVGWGERLVKWVRRQPAVSALVAVAAAGVVTVVLAMTAPTRPHTSTTSPPPPLIWDFSPGDFQGTTSKGAYLVDDRLWDRPGGHHVRFMDVVVGGESWLEATCTLPEDAEAPGGRRGRWVLEVHHLSSAKMDGPGYSPVRLSLNGSEVWVGSPVKNNVVLVPGGVAWRRQEWDVTDHIRPGLNTLRWDGLPGATTHYWLKSFRLFWKPVQE
jgi:hypothetical protein